MAKLTKLERRLLRSLGKANADFGLIQPGDRVLACVSGGKDSVAMMHLLALHRARVPFDFELSGMLLDQGQPGFAPEPLVAWMEEQGHDFRVVRQDTYRTVGEILKPGETPCSLCARLRRGRLYQEAFEGGYDKIAFGHHRDDALETLLLNLFYAGSIGSMAPRFTSDDGRNVMIRPLYYCAEEDIAALAQEQGFPILPCGLCDDQPEQKRQAMKALLSELQADNPKVKGNMMTALRNVNASHLLDPRLHAALGLETCGAD
jgi:tRNA 2-thiocytidine biosynthesis protein TtcA